MNKLTMVTSAGFVALLAAGAANAQDAMASPAGYPPDARPGQCFARVLIPETTEVRTEEVVDQPERTDIRVIPAVYADADERVIVKEETKVLRVIPATFKTVTETVVVEPERREVRVIPAVTESYDERVLVKPAYTTWKPGAGLFGRVRTGASALPGATATGDELATGELLCKVEVPAEYKTVKRTRVVKPERTEEIVIPAKVQTVTRQVVDQPARTVEEIIPAEYRTVKVRKMVSPPRTEQIVIPASVRTMQKRVVTGGGGLQWREVLCETNTSPAKIREVQGGLQRAGLYQGPIDGVFGMSTLTAMEAFQRRNGLAVGNLTIETVRALGVTP